MKKQYLVSLMVFIVVAIGAQNGSDNETSLDDKIAKKDSLSEIINQDSVISNHKILVKELGRFLDSLTYKRKNQYSDIIYRENFHLKSPFRLNYRFIKNGFSVIPYKTRNIDILQNYTFSHAQDHKNGMIYFRKNNFALPVSVTESYLGLGDNDMNHAVVKFVKGKIFGINNLNLELDYFGYEGKWLGVNEKSSNLDIHIMYKSQLGNIHLFNNTIQQDISSSKLFEPVELNMEEVVNKNISDRSLLFENKYLNLGLRAETCKIDTTERHLYEALLHRRFEMKKHTLDLAYEYFVSNNIKHGFSLVTLAHNSKVSFLEFRNSGYYKTNEDMLLSSDLVYDPLQFTQIGFNITKKNDEYSQRETTSLDLILRNSKLKSKFSWGTSYKQPFEDVYFGWKNRTDFRLNKFTILVQNHLIIDEKGLISDSYDTIESYPKYRMQNSLEFSLNLENHNKIILGLQHTYISSFKYDQDTISKRDFSNLDAFLSFQISKLFKISANAINLTNSERPFTYPSSEKIPGTHFNFKVHWIFVN